MDFIDLAYLNFKKDRNVGEIRVLLPDPPIRSKVLNYKLPKEKQMWIRQAIPDEMRFAAIEDLSDANYTIVERELERVKNGVWFFNNGNLEFLTGPHYLLLNYFKIGNEYPKWLDAQRDVYQCWFTAENDRKSMGVLFLSRRRFGKTEIIISIIYQRSITNKNHHGGIQSKTDKDAKLIFKKLISHWKRLPQFLKPRDQGDTNPQGELRFSEPGKRSATGEVKKYTESLDSWIDFKAAGEEVYDGDKINTYLGDEIGKTLSSDVYERHQTIVPTLLDDAKIIGKAFLTSTVEEMVKKGGKNAKRIWDKSNPHQRNIDGRTGSGLYRIIIPCYYSYRGDDDADSTAEQYIDKYGYSNLEYAKAYFTARRKELEGLDLQSERRKFPFDASDAFNTGSLDSPMPLDLLYDQKGRLEDLLLKKPGLINRVTFYKTSEEEIKWRSDPNGRWEMLWDFPGFNQSGKYHWHEGSKAPSNTHRFIAGADPFAADKVLSGGSKGAGYMFMKLDLADPENTGMFICKYSARPKTQNEFHEDMMLMIEYYGSAINYESDVDSFFGYYRDRRMPNYLIDRPKSTIDPERVLKVLKKGTPSKDRFALARFLEIYVGYLIEHVSKIYFMSLLDDLIEYDHENRTKSDETVASGMALIGATVIEKIIINKTFDKPMIKVYDTQKVVGNWKNW